VHQLPKTGSLWKGKAMKITYRESKEFTPAQLEDLFSSVKWESGKYPNRLAEGMKNSSVVISAWDRDTLVGLVRSLDDGATTAFLHYLLVRPAYQKLRIGYALMEKMMRHYTDFLYVKIMPSDKAVVPFYQKFGFKNFDNYCALEVKNLGRVADKIPSGR
jgi:GNAT superfamily N-acetyltransferase